MMRTQPAAGALTGLDAALAALLDGLAPVAPSLLPLDEALGRVAAEMPPLARAQPPRSLAVVDGWAFHALDLAGASAYSPLPLLDAPIRVEAGDALPEGCDCVLEAGLVDCSGPIVQALAEAVPGQGVRRAGEDFEAGSSITRAGVRLTAIDLLAARSAGVGDVAARVPRLRMIDVAAASGVDFTTRFIAEIAKANGAAVSGIETAPRDAASIARTLGDPAYDLVVLIGGTGVGRTDATAEALASCGTLLAHNIALQPGRTVAAGRLGDTPVVALPGAPDQALGAFLALVQPVLDRLSGLSVRRSIVMPLARKIASTVGIAEIVLLKQEDDAWNPLAVGDFPLHAMRSADAWLAIPGGSEGYAAGTPVGAFPLRDS